MSSIVVSLFIKLPDFVKFLSFYVWAIGAGKKTKQFLHMKKEFKLFVKVEK
jgi:hypothetical protein